MNDPPEDLKRVRIAPAGGRAVVAVDGHDVSSLVRAYTVHQEAGEPSTVVLQFTEHVPTEVEGLARVVVGVPPDPGPAAAAFLEAIDARQLEEAALSRPDLLDGRPHELTRAMLRLLTDWARGGWTGWEPADDDAEPDPAP
ncbi:hypothetical protein SRB5_15740 [Streptomyces sp. RB5]|uniref:Uncharacterized protein n=1 Tax=Streptomyces smaragdinus TaxID=2585196 RepID=A0A7K0CDJ8_9ACTN|nr:hypothetical protein [Streptomyces smaragdinus]MQY11456.1 hypothetical protein [Streptomyces smaragdinus]